MKKVTLVFIFLIILFTLEGFICAQKESVRSQPQVIKEIPEVTVVSADRLSELTQNGREFINFYEKNRSTLQYRDLIGHLSEIADRLKFDEVNKLIPLTTNEAREVLHYRLIRFYLHYSEFSKLYKEILSFEREFPQSLFITEVNSIKKRIEKLVTVSPNKIGVLLPLSGKYRNFGEQFIKNLELFEGFMRVENPDEKDLRYISTDGIEFVFKDTEGEESRVEKAVMELINNENIIAILGPVFIQESEKAAYLSSRYNIPIIILSRKDDITSAGEYVFRNCLTNRLQATEIARYAIQKLNLERFAIIYPNNNYGVELTNYFWDEVERNNREVTGVESYDVDQTTFTAPSRKITGKFYPELRTKRKDEEIELPKWAEGLSGARLEALLKKMKANFPPIVDFDALFIPDYYDKVSLVVPAVAYEDVMFTNATKKELENAEKVLGIKNIKPVQLLGANGWNSEELIKRMGKYAENAIFIDGFFADSENEYTSKYVQLFTFKYQTKPNLIDSQFYDTILITLHILRNRKPQSREEFVESLKRLSGVFGSGGELKVNEKREVLRPLKILTVKDRKIVEMDEIKF